MGKGMKSLTYSWMKDSLNIDSGHTSNSLSFKRITGNLTEDCTILTNRIVFHCWDYGYKIGQRQQL